MKKKLCCVFAAVLVFVQIFCVGCGYTTTEDKLLRIHVRADSDDPSAQAVKKEVVAALQLYLSGELCGADNYGEAYKTVKERCGILQEIASAVLRRNGFGYSATAELVSEYFPARVYGETVVESGVYDALIVKLGTGGGDNWWCVLYPGLCYTPNSTDEIAYKSLIAEIIKKHL